MWKTMHTGKHVPLDYSVVLVTRKLQFVWCFSVRANRPLMPALLICMLFCMIIWSGVLWRSLVYTSATEPLQGENEKFIVPFYYFRFCSGAFNFYVDCFVFVLFCSFYFFDFTFSRFLRIVTTVALAPEHSLANSNLHTHWCLPTWLLHRKWYTSSAVPAAESLLNEHT